LKKIKTLLTVSVVGLVAWMLTTNVMSGELRPFTSDGCSAFPNGTLEQNQLWLHCCRAHDFAYWKGGSYEQRSIADQKLKTCVADVGEEHVASLMLAGVRVGGTPFLPTPFRWGYGWPYPKLYGELTQEEKAQVKRLMHDR
jgi:hypothetical protein